MKGTKKFNALLFDTRSIQKYIYSGNLLRTNIGASYIVDRVFFDILVEGTLKKFFPEEDFSSAQDTAWEIEQDKVAAWENMKNCCAAYIGGGKALILFNQNVSKDTCKEIVKDFTLELLKRRPGLKVGAAFEELTLIDSKLDEDKIFNKLKENQNNIFPAVNVPYSGLTLSCEINGETANFCDTRGRVKPGNEVRFYSKETAVKAEMSTAANENLRERFNKIFDVKKVTAPEKFEFPTKVDELGQREGENYFSIVHVDGNNMGVKFQSCKNLTERRQLSREIRRKTEGAFADLLLKIIAAKEKDLFDKVLDLKDKKILPVRPLILGGDDVTFICPAKLAILFTKTLMESLNAATLENSPEKLKLKAAQKMDCCAGVAILPTAYPFFRGYILAEQLCDAAKKSMRSEKNPAGSSWLDFAILHGEQAPTLEQIRRREYTGARGNLHFGPYKVCGSTDFPRNIENLISCTTQFLNSKKENPPQGTMAHGKIKELRFVLQRGKSDAENFLNQLERQNQKLPNIPAWKEFAKTLWSNEKTPYVDAIELMDFYSAEVAEQWQNLTYK